MPRVYYTIDPENPDPENGEFYIVNYRTTTPEARERAARRSRQFQAYIEEINSSPLTKYLYERELNQRHHARRLAKQRGWDTRKFEDVFNYVKSNWNNSEEPTIIGSNRSHEEGFTRAMTFRQHLTASRRAPDSAHLNAVERAANSGNYKVRNFNKSFIEAVKAARNSAGLTQKDLADKVNRPVNEIAQLERGELPYDGQLKSLLHNALGFDSVSK